MVVGGWQQMVIRRAWFDGLGRVFAAPAMIAGVFVTTLLTALPLALSLRDSIEAHLGASLAADQAADSVNFDWWQEFAGQASGIGSMFTPTIIGFATTLDSFSALLDARTLLTPIAWALAIYAAAWLFLSGGIIDRYARGKPIGAHGFFGAAGIFFFRFIRLGIGAAVVYWFLFAYVHDWLFAKWYVNATRDLAVEHVAFYWRLLMYGIFGALLALTTIVFDYAKVRAVVEDRRSMVGALIASTRFIRRHPGRVAGLFIANVAAFLLVVGIWAIVAPGAGGSGLSMWAGVIASQCYILARLVVRLQFIASETTLFQRSLAHYGYTLTPPVAPPSPAIIETL